MGQFFPDRSDHLHHRAGHVARLVEEAQLMSSAGPDSSQHGRVEIRSVCDDLVRFNTHLLEMGQKTLNVSSVHGSVHQLIADQTITVGSSRISSQQECELVLIELIHTEDAGELVHHPGLVVNLEVEPGTIDTAPAPNYAFARTDPEVSCHSLSHSSHCHIVPVD
jgi:hypothetical protein